MQEFFCDRRVSCGINGKPDELMVFKKIGRSYTAHNENYLFRVILEDNTTLACGDLVTDPSGMQYLTIVRRDSYLSKTAQVLRVNCDLKVQRLSKVFIGGAVDHYTVSKESTGIPSFYREVTAKMQQYDLGLLSTTTIEFVTQVLDVKLTDRIVFSSQNYIVNAINTTKYEGLLAIQCSPDNSRVVK